MCSNRECLAESIAAAGAGHRFSGIGAGAGGQSDLAARPAPVVITSLTVLFFAVIVSALARGLNIECGCFGTIGGKHVGRVNLARMPARAIAELGACSRDSGVECFRLPSADVQRWLPKAGLACRGWIH
jgi:hypothetical protein